MNTVACRDVLRTDILKGTRAALRIPLVAPPLTDVPQGEVEFARTSGMQCPSDFDHMQDVVGLR
jgi:hypothetical protein